MKGSLLTLLALALSLTTSAQDFTYEYEGQTLHYTIIDETDKTCTPMPGEGLYPGNRVSGDLIIPAEANGYTVRFIDAAAFINCHGLTSVTLPESITHIGPHAFASCSNLASITLPNSLTYIGFDVFGGCTSLTDVSIPASVTVIDDGAFSSCSNLSEINVDKNNERFSSIDGVVFDKGHTTLRLFPSGRNGEYTIPSYVTTIGPAAFATCKKLTSITIPATVTIIDYEAFLGCTGLTDIVLPNSVEWMGDAVFMNCSSLKSITFSSALQVIPPSCFYSCTGLTSIFIPSSIISIQSSAFECCSRLSRAAYPSSLSNPFPSSVTAVAYNPREVTIKGQWIYRDNDTEIVYAPIQEDGKYSVPEGVTTIGEMAYAGCYNMTSMVIPDAVTDIATGAFKNCKSLTDVTLPMGLETLGEAVFKGCSNLSNVVYRAPKPVNSTYNCFDLSVYLDGTLYVPSGTAASFHDALPWGYFYNVTDKPYNSSVIEAITSYDSAIDPEMPYSVYTYLGTFVGSDISALAPGIYIVRQGDKVKKIAVR